MYTMVGVKRVSFLISEDSSLKDKRQVLRELRETIKSKFNVSFAEVNQNDQLQRNTIAVSMVACDQEIIRAAFAQISNLIESFSGVRVFNESNDIFRYENEKETVHLS